MLIRNGKLKEINITFGVLSAFMHKFSTSFWTNNCETSALFLSVPEVLILDLTLETGQIYLQSSWVFSISLGKRSVGDTKKPQFFFKHL
jgi:hypothetical protein